MGALCYAHSCLPQGGRSWRWKTLAIGRSKAPATWAPMVCLCPALAQRRRCCMAHPLVPFGATPFAVLLKEGGGGGGGGGVGVWAGQSQKKKGGFVNLKLAPNFRPF